MKNKNIFLILIIALMINLILITQVNAFFTRTHNYITLKAADDTKDSFIMQECGDRMDLLIDGNMAADIFVIHYTDANTVSSYISTHSKFSGFQRCFDEAGNDKELQCFCYGMGLHIIQDNFAHNANMLVPKYLQKYATSNLIGHMSVELDMEKQGDKLYADDVEYSSGKVDLYDRKVLDNLFSPTVEYTKYIKVLSKITGLPETQVKNDALTIQQGYKGQGFFNTVYGQKSKLPVEVWYISIGLIIAAILVPIIFLIIIPRLFNLQMTRWRFFLWALCIALLIIGALIIVSFVFGTTWQWVRLILRVVPIRVNDGDVRFYTGAALDATKEFLRSGNIPYDDVSGLSYRDSQGNWHTGALATSEFNYHAFMLPGITITISLIIIFLLFKTYTRKKK